MLDAYKARLEEQGFTGDNYKEQLRKFYEAYAYCWRVQYDDSKFNILINSDIHSHARLRVNGVHISGKGKVSPFSHKVTERRVSVTLMHAMFTKCLPGKEKYAF